MTANCERHEIDPFAYLQDILHRLPTHPVERLDELLPDICSDSHLNAMRKIDAFIGPYHIHRLERDRCADYNAVTRLYRECIWEMIWQ